MERDKLEHEIQRGLLHEGGEQPYESLQSLRLVRKIVQEVVGVLPFVDSSRSNEVTARVFDALKRLGVGSPQAIEFLPWDMSTSSSLAEIPELEKPVHARWFIDTLRRKAPSVILQAGQRGSRETVAPDKGQRLL
eukprot:5975227-Prymnesium_polylepis.2